MSEKLRKALDVYVKNAAEHGAATRAGDHRRANRCSDRIEKALRDIRDCGTAGENALLRLTQHGDTSVRCWAATHSLPGFESEAKAVLQELATGDDIVSFGAKIVLQQWEEGERDI